MTNSSPTAPTFPPQATGDPWDPENPEVATVPVPLAVVIVNVEGPFTEQDRKLWTFLLHASWEKLDEPIHSVSVTELARTFRKITNSHYASSWIWDSARRLSKTTVEWRYTYGDNRFSRGIASLFSAELSSEAEDSGVLRYAFPSLLIPILKDPRRYARLRTHVMMQLSGKYSVTLYELLESVVNMRKPVLTASLAEIREWLKVPTGKLTRWPDLQRYALKSAIDEINRNAEATGFTVKMTTEQEGRAVKGVRFYVLKTSERADLDRQYQEREGEGTPLPLFEVQLQPKTYEIAQSCAPGWDVKFLEREWMAWGQKKQTWPPRNPDGAFISFCKKKGERD